MKNIKLDQVELNKEAARIATPVQLEKLAKMTTMGWEIYRVNFDRFLSKGDIFVSQKNKQLNKLVSVKLTQGGDVVRL